MKKVGFALLSAVAVLAACGQGEDTTPVDTNTNAEVSNVETENNVSENNVVENNDGSANNATDAEEPVVNNEEEAGNDVNEEPVNEETATIDNEAVNNEEEEEAVSNDTEANEEAIDVQNVYLYFSDDQLLETYRVETDQLVSMDETGAMEAMALWEAGPSQEGLFGLLPEGASVESVEIDGSTAYVSLSSEVENANLGSSGEAMLTEQIAMMMQQFGATETMLLIEGDEIGEFLGHLDLSTPIQAGNPEDYPVYQ
ncbi:GerMN domain-containing protein [Paenalkalicoccus suaedae]|uniref:GerMN domain-containing protein n=1 Tax=Paenalkalicoccus suaedae TaxID=2592382 RepID=A0A859FA85_9BACI|nr:GerMN domain-containing protein [Paenalkalicoccus suaedae]QKS70173.1 GerMN domain-containing protein [Paenalkalicoccus suaedae]